MARRLGWSDEVLAGLEKFEQLDLDEPTRVALRFAERMTCDANAVDEDLYRSLRRHYDEGAVVELAAVIGLFAYFNRFNNAFQMEPTQPGDR